MPVKTFRTRKQMFALFMPGFLCGILYVNFALKQYMTDMGIFNLQFLEQYTGTDRTGADAYAQDHLVCISYIDGLFFRDSADDGSILYGFERDCFLYSWDLSAVFVLYSGICGRAVVRDDLSPESVESPENDICDRNDVDGTDFGSIREPGVCKDDFFIKRYSL